MIKLTPLLGILMSMCWTLPALANCGVEPQEFLAFIEGLQAQVRAGEFDYVSLDDGSRCPPVIYSSSPVKLYWHPSPDEDGTEILYVTTGKGPCGFTQRTPVSEVTSVTFGIRDKQEKNLTCGVIQGTIRPGDNTTGDKPFN